MDFRKLFGRGRSENETVAADLRAAADWLSRQNLANAREWALGEERTFEVDQEAGRMTLFFEDGIRAVLPIQLIASFLPTDGSVRWTWANDSVDSDLAAAARALKEYGEAQGVADLTRPEQIMKFEDLVKYSALAAFRFGCTGLYRCLRRDHSTVFVGFNAPELQSEDGSPLSADGMWPEGRASEAFQAEAKSLVEAWDSEMFPIDREFNRMADRSDEERIDAADAALDSKLAIYERYWRPRNDLWRPDSFGWPSEHDPDPFLPTETLPRRAGGCFVLRRPSPHQDLAYVVEDRDGELRITDIDLDWGAALVWAGPSG